MKIILSDVGRNKGTTTITVPDSASSDDIERAVMRAARPFLASRLIEASMHSAGGGSIYAGFHTVGRFTCEAEASHD